MRVSIFVARATRSSFLKEFKYAILKFQKILLKILDVGNVVFYQRAKFEFQIPYI
jgi:hypothetical protein